MTKKFVNLTNNDIKKNKYSLEQIEYSIINNNLSLRLVNRYQILTPYICAKYIIFGGNEEQYGDCTEDCWLSDDDILYRQPHITKDDLLNAHDFVYLEEINEYNERLLMSNEDRLSN